MGSKVKIDLPHYPDVEIGIVGIGVAENGGEIDIGEAEEAAFYAQNGYTIHEADQEGITVTGSPEFTPPEPPVEVEEQPPVEVPPPVEEVPPPVEGGEV